MKKKLALYGFLAVTLIIATAEVQDNSGQPGYTGSPNEGTCISCHSGAALNSGGGSVTITSDIPGTKYLLNQTYHINVTVSQSGVSLFGFGMEALVNSNKNNAGTLIITDNTQTQLLSRTVAGVSRKNVVHKLNGGAGTDTKSFSFNWLSPSTNVGSVTFYAVGNATNANNNSAGDFIYSTTQAIAPDPILSIATLSENEQVSVFPNPVKDHFILSIHNERPSEINAQLYNLNGELAYKLPDEGMEAGLTEKRIDLDPSLQKGVYLLQLNRNGKATYKKIIVQ
jgi:hypothetical protein